MAISEINVGSTPNDGTGDSIRDAFSKVNDNFVYLDEARQNLTTGNLTATGNVSLQASVPSYWTGTYYLNGVEVATVGTLFSGGTVSDPTQFQASTPSTSNTSGAVVISGGLGVAGSSYLSSLFARQATIDLSLSTTSLTVFGTSGLAGRVTTGPLETSGTFDITGNITVGNISALASNPTKRSIDASFGTFSEVTGTLQTAAQPNVTSLGTLASLAVTGNISAANITLTWGQVTASKAVISGNVSVGSNLLVQGATSLTGNITAGNISANIGGYTSLTVNTIPTVKSVTTKEYVTATVVGFAIGLGS
jgi:hypothetical protein